MSLATARADIVAADVKETYSVIRSICNQAKEVALAKMTVYTADNFDIEMKQKQYYIKTYSADFNNMIGGGIPTMSITGTSARFSSGKTQIGYDAILHVLAYVFMCTKCRRVYKVPPVFDDSGNLAKEGTPYSKDDICCGQKVKHAKAVMIETEPDTFHLDRLKQMASIRGLSSMITWSNLYILPAKQIPTMKAQYLQYKLVQKLLEGQEYKEIKDVDGKVVRVVEAREPEPIILVDVDSFNAKLRAGWGESQQLPLRTRELAEHFTLMEYLAATYNIAWYLTHQVIAPVRPDQGLAIKVKFLDEYYPVGGDYDLHSVNNWVALANATKDIVEAELFDSSWKPKGHCFFKLTAKGIENGAADMAKRIEARQNAKVNAAKTEGKA